MKFVKYDNVLFLLSGWAKFDHFKLKGALIMFKTKQDGELDSIHLTVEVFC